MRNIIFIGILSLFIASASAASFSPFNLYANGEQGLVYVNASSNINLTVTAPPNVDIAIQNDEPLWKDIVLCKGVSDSSGNFACTINLNQSESLKLQGYADIQYGHYTLFSNPITLKVGTPGVSNGETITIIISFIILFIVVSNLLLNRR